MREKSDWPPATTPESREQRGERVLEARQKILYQPIPHDIALTPASKVSRRRWLWGSAALLIFSAVAVWIGLMTDWRGERAIHSFLYQLSFTPPFLSEDLALAKAQEALAECGVNTNLWKAIAESSRLAEAGTVAPDGRRDVYLLRVHPNLGLMTFDTATGSKHERLVTIELQGRTVLCSVSRMR